MGILLIMNQRDIAARRARCPSTCRPSKPCRLGEHSLKAAESVQTAMFAVCEPAATWKTHQCLFSLTQYIFLLVLFVFDCNPLKSFMFLRPVFGSGVLGVLRCGHPQVWQRQCQTPGVVVPGRKVMGKKWQNYRKLLEHPR